MTLLLQQQLRQLQLQAQPLPQRIVSCSQTHVLVKTQGIIEEGRFKRPFFWYNPLLLKRMLYER